MRGNERKTIAVIAACVVIAGAMGTVMPGRKTGMVSPAEESFARTEVTQEDADTAVDGEDLVLEDEYGMKLVDSSAAEEAAYYSAEEADLADATWDFSEVEEGAFEPLTPEEAGLAGDVESMAVKNWNSKHSISWDIYLLDTVFTARFTMTSGQYLNICTTFSPSTANGYVCYATPDKVIHVLSYASSMTKTVKASQTGYYRVGFCNRGVKTVRLTGYYRTSK